MPQLSKAISARNRYYGICLGDRVRSKTGLVIGWFDRFSLLVRCQQENHNIQGMLSLLLAVMPRSR